MDRLGDWMVTWSGRPYWPMDPRPDDVRIEDIAASLSKLCRFAGHTHSFYSVAEHSVLVSMCVPHEHALQALLHDATEAYCVDVPRPLKRGLGAAYADIEQRNWVAIAAHFGLPVEMHPSVKHADDAVLVAEKQVLIHQDCPPWTAWELPPAADVQIYGWFPHTAQRHFLARYEQLTNA